MDLFNTAPIGSAGNGNALSALLQLIQKHANQPDSAMASTGLPAPAPTPAQAAGANPAQAPAKTTPFMGAVNGAEGYQNLPWLDSGQNFAGMVGAAGQGAGGVGGSAISALAKLFL